MQSDARRRHLKGLAITSLGVFILSVDSLFIRLIGADALSQLPWRGLPMALIALVVFLPLFRGWSGMKRSFATFGWKGLVATGLFVLTSFGFVGGVHATNVPTLLVIVATTPFFAALAGWLIYRAHVPTRTWVAIAIGVVGIAIAVQGWLAAGNLWGIAICLLTPVCLGIFLSVLEHEPQIDNLVVMVLAPLVYAAVGIWLADPLAITGTERIYALIHGLIILPLAFALYTTGPKYISGPETSLILLLETVLGAYWVWLVLSETPTAAQLVGGTIVISTVAVHAVLSYQALDQDAGGAGDVPPTKATKALAQ